MPTGRNISHLKPTTSFAGTIALASAIVLGACSLGACSDDEQDIELSFAAQVGTEDFGCGNTYSDVGETQSELRLDDLRLYVHNIRLVDASGAEQALALEQDGKWQLEDIALLDFEDGSATCENGTPETRTTVTGTAPSGSYVGVRMSLGVPFARNHGDAAVAPPPLNLTAMFWNWNAGYKFLRVDGNAPELEGWRLHLGSTGCDGDSMGNVTECQNPNRSELAFDDFTPGESRIVVDVAELLRGASLASNIADTPPGCMSGGDDDDCAPYFANLGLPWKDSSATEQRMFRSEPMDSP